MKKDRDILFRDKELGDESFIYSSQIKNLYDSYPYCHCKYSIFSANQSKLIENLFTISRTLIASLREEPEIIIGYLMYNIINNNIIVHYAYVKRAFRHNFVLSDLLETAKADWRQNLVIISQMNDLYPILKENHYNLTYDPFIIETILEANK